MERLSIDEVIDHCNRKVKWWEKLIPRAKFENRDINDSACREYWEHRQVAEWLEQLKSYKVAEEQGLLHRLPCKVGNKAWYVHRKGIDEVEVDSFIININIFVNVSLYIGGDRFGKTLTPYKTLFFTQEEAEAALEKMKGAKMKGGVR